LQFGKLGYRYYSSKALNSISDLRMDKSVHLACKTDHRQFGSATLLSYISVVFVDLSGLLGEVQFLLLQR
jgi:hypothetical protein